MLIDWSHHSPKTKFHVLLLLSGQQRLCFCDVSSSGQLRDGSLTVLEPNGKIDPINALPLKLFCPSIYLSSSPSVFFSSLFLPPFKANQREERRKRRRCDQGEGGAHRGVPARFNIWRGEMWGEWTVFRSSLPPPTS